MMTGIEIELHRTKLSKVYNIDLVERTDSQCERIKLYATGEHEAYELVRRIKSAIEELTTQTQVIVYDDIAKNLPPPRLVSFQTDGE